jgi:hypothetical protein
VDKTHIFLTDITEMLNQYTSKFDTTIKNAKDAISKMIDKGLQAAKNFVTHNGSNDDPSLNHQPTFGHKEQNIPAK